MSGAGDNKTLPERFWAKVDKTGPMHNGECCWLWTARVNDDGYGVLGVATPRGRRTVRAHRVAYELMVAPIPEGLVTDHLCRRRACVNPAHLELVTPRENLLRGNNIAARRAAATHCLRGHEFTPENTWVFTGTRHCKKCQRIRQTARRALGYRS